MLQQQRVFQLGLECGAVKSSGNKGCCKGELRISAFIYGGCHDSCRLTVLPRESLLLSAVFCVADTSVSVALQWAGE